MSTLLATIIADFQTQLATAIAVSGTTATLQSATDDDGIALPTGRYFLTIDGNNSSKEHFSCTLTGTALTALKSVSRQGVETSGAVRAHRIGATVTITDFAHILQINNLLNGTTNLNASTPLSYDGTASITTSNQLATKAYADGLAIAGAPDSSTTVKGIGKVSVAPVSPTAPIFVGDNDTRVPPVNTSTITSGQVAALAGTGTPAVGNKFVTADTNALNELLSHKSTTTTLGTSDTLYPTQNAVKTYSDLKSRPIAVRTSQLVVGSGSSTETDVIANTSLPGGSLSAGRAIRYEGYFSYTPGNSSATITFGFYYGGTEVGTLVLGGANLAYTGYFSATVAYVGASSQYVSGSAVATVTTTASTGGVHSTFVSTTSAIDESAAQNVKMTVKGSASNTLILETVHGATIHLI